MGKDRETGVTYHCLIAILEGQGTVQPDTIGGHTYLHNSSLFVGRNHARQDAVARPRGLGRSGAEPHKVGLAGVEVRTEDLHWVEASPVASGRVDSGDGRLEDVVRRNEGEHGVDGVTRSDRGTKYGWIEWSNGRWCFRNPLFLLVAVYVKELL